MLFKELRFLTIMLKQVVVELDVVLGFGWLQRRFSIYPQTIHLEQE